MGAIEPLRITGYSVCGPLGLGLTEVAECLRGGRSGLGPVPFELPFPTVVGAVTEALPQLPTELAAWSTRPARMAAHLVSELEEPLAQARERWAPSRIGVILGTSTAGADSTERAYRHHVEHGVLPPNYDFRCQHSLGAILHVVKTLGGIAGPSWMVATTCTASAKPLASALRLMAAGVLDAAIVGGIDTLCAMTLTGFHSLDALSNERCRPFCKDRKGINVGEGGAFLLLEKAGPARALLLGVGESSDAYHISAPHPEGLGAQLAMERALEMGGCGAEAVDYLNAHGTATPLNDIAEGLAVARVLGPEVPVVSTKGYTGHALGGAGAMEAVFAAMAIERGFIPASLNVEPIDPRLNIHVNTETREGSYRRVLSNSLAFGGNNVSVLLGAA